MTPGVLYYTHDYLIRAMNAGASEKAIVVTVKVWGWPEARMN